MPSATDLLEIPRPGSSSGAYTSDMSRQALVFNAVTGTAEVSATKSVRSLELLSYHGAMKLFQEARALFARDARPVAVSARAAFDAIRDLSIREYEVMQMTGTLGDGDVHFSSYVYCQCMFAALHRVVFTHSVGQMVVRTHAVNFAARLTTMAPDQGVGVAAAGRASAAAPATYRSAPAQVVFTGCFVCGGAHRPTVGHAAEYANGQHPVMSPARKAAVHAAIDGATTSAEARVAARSRAEAYWARLL